MGRPPKPNALKKLAGNPGKRKLPRNPEPKKYLPQCPRHLSPVAKVEWHRVVKELYDLGLLTRIDSTALAAYCQSYSDWVEATKKLKDGNYTIISPKGYEMQSPWVAIGNKALEKMAKFMSEFGMTPASRGRIRMPDKEVEDPFEQWARKELEKPVKKSETVEEVGEHEPD